MTFPLPRPSPTTRAMPDLTFDSRAESVIFYGVFALLLFGPLASGAVEPWSLFILQLGATLLSAIWIMSQFKARQLRITGNVIFAPMLAFAILVIVQLASGRTEYRAATLSSLLRYSTYGLLLFLCVQSFSRRSQARTIATLVPVYGFLIAAFAVVQSLTSNGKVYWTRTPASPAWIYGPYVNHNHYAGLMEMLIPIPLILSLSPRVDISRRIMCAACAAFMASTVLLSGSRGGMIALGIEISFFLGTVLTTRQRRPGSLLALLAVICMGLTFSVWLGGKELTDRVFGNHPPSREFSASTRLQIDHDALTALRERPILGWGLGTFANVHKQHQSFYANYTIDHAHNDYFELLVETGAVGFGIMLWFLIAVYQKSRTTLKAHHHLLDGEITWAALLGITGILVHSFVDFNLQIPANAAFFYVLVGIAGMDPRFASHRRHIFPAVASVRREILETTAPTSTRLAEENAVQEQKV